MANKATYFMGEFKKGDFMLWSVCSQTLGLFTVTIRDDRKIYAQIRKGDHMTSLQKLSQDFPIPIVLRMDPIMIITMFTSA